MDDPQLAQEARAPAIIHRVEGRERLPVAGLRFSVVARETLDVRDPFAGAGDRRLIAGAAFQRVPEVGQRLVDGVEALRTLPRAEQGSRGLCVVTATRVAVGNDVDVLSA